MGKNKAWLLVFCIVCFFSSAVSQPVLEDYPVIEKVAERRKELLRIAESQVGIKETAYNDGKEIRKYQQSVNIPKGSFWCAAFVVWCHLQLNPDFPIPHSGWSPALFNSNVVYRKTAKRITPYNPRGGEIFGKYYPEKGRVAHVGIIKEKLGNHYHTIEGNVSMLGAILKTGHISSEQDRDGIWVAKKIRSETDVFIVSDYVGYEELKASATIATKNKFFRLK